MSTRVSELLDKELSENNAIKFGVSLQATFIKQNHTDVPDYLTTACGTDRDIVVLNKNRDT